MEYSNFSLTLDIHKASAQTCLTVKQGDTGRQLLVRLTENGRPYPISSDCTAVFTARKPDGRMVFNHCEISQSVIVYALTPQTTAVAGQAECELRLYGADDRLLTSPRFSLLVDPTVYQEGDPVESAQEVTALTQLLCQTSELVTEVEDKLASGAFRGEKGEEGTDGKTPVKGVDYFTPEEKEEMVAEVRKDTFAVLGDTEAALDDILAIQDTYIGGMPLFGTVDADKNILLFSVLPDGSYTLKYEDGQGTLTEIATLQIGSVNQIPRSTEADGVTPYNGGLGYKENTRWSASGGGDIKADGVVTSGYIPVTAGDVIRIKHIRMNKNDTASNVCNVCVFTALGVGSSADASILTDNWDAVWDDEGNLVQFTINNSITYIRLNAAYIGEDSILTINEELPE